MSVSRTTIRLLATCVASGALVGAAALPALAAGSDHDRDNGRSYSHSYWSGHDHDGRFGYRDRWDRDRDGGWRWDRDRGCWVRDWGWHRDHGWHHGWYGDRHRDHDRYFGHR
ncbi:hypothetical protein [Streptomyces sp. NPDC001792]|jgi:hypothetical protein|uniref:hypothetical protein n=1 Tax=unclassified Streptomyces TaxID=2593676 RepID=UPI003318B0F2